MSSSNARYKNSTEKTTEKFENPQINFYFFSETNNGKRLSISKLRLIDYLKNLGFRRFDIDLKNSIYVQVKDNVLKEVNEHYIRTVVRKDIEKAILKDVSNEQLLEKLIKGANIYLSKATFDFLDFEKEPIFNTDTKDKSYSYFKNGFVEVSKKGIFLKSYKELQNYIWANQIIDYELKLLGDGNNAYETQGYFADFCSKIAKYDFETNENYDNWTALMVIIGYLLHSYKAGERKIINFTDSNISKGNEGRSGKTLLSKGIGKLKVYAEINGKDFTTKDKHRYQTCNLDTEIVNLNDVKKSFKLEHVYNDVTEGLMVEKKRMLPFRIMPKMIITSNLPLIVETGSDKARVLEFAFSDFWNSENTPPDYYKYRFFEEWKEEREIEWTYFYNFLLNCQKAYFDNDCKLIEPENSTLAQRKLLNETSEDFLDFITYIELGKEYDKKELFNDFKELYPDAKDMKQNTFTKWINRFVKYNQYELESDYKKDRKVQRVKFINPNNN